MLRVSLESTFNSLCQREERWWQDNWILGNVIIWLELWPHSQPFLVSQPPLRLMNTSWILSFLDFAFSTLALILLMESFLSSPPLLCALPVFLSPCLNLMDAFCGFSLQPSFLTLLISLDGCTGFYSFSMPRMVLLFLFPQSSWSLLSRP